MKPTKRATDTVTESLMKVSLNSLSVSTDHRQLLHILLRCCLIFISLRRCVDFLLSLSLPFFVFVFIHMSQSHLFVVLESLKKVAFKLQRSEMLVFVPLFARLLDIKKSVSLWVVFNAFQPSHWTFLDFIVLNAVNRCISMPIFVYFSNKRLAYVHTLWEIPLQHFTLQNFVDSTSWTLIDTIILGFYNLVVSATCRRFKPWFNVVKCNR